MYTPIIFGYKEGLRSARLLAEALDCPYHYPGSGYRHELNHLIVNWGNGDPIGVSQEAKVLNKYRAVRNSVYKGISFDLFQREGVTIPDRTVYREKAIEWIRQGEVVFCRQTLHGQNGAGIIVAKEESDLTWAELYTKYVKNRDEFRVHVFKEIPIFWTKKEVSWDASNEPNHYVKSGNDWTMGWVDDIPDICKQEAIKATAALGLDFAAVDIGMNYYRNKAYVFETNTAPGGFGPITLQKYVEAIKRELDA